MASNSSYDRDLLASAPVATRQERQEGYNVDLLEKGDGPARTPSGRGSPVPVSLKEQTLPTPQRRTTDETSSPSLKRATPFWRTGKGIGLIVIAIIVILGAVIGGAVGGTVGKNHHSNSATSGGSASMTSGSSPSQGVGTDSGGSNTAISPGGAGSVASPSPSASASALIGMGR